MTATKFHVNGKGEVGACRAKVRCRFGGESGVENHFDTAEAAHAAVQKSLQEEFSNVSPLRRKPSPQFVAIRDNITNAMVSYGIVETTDQLEEVNNTEEMVDKWFGGSTKRYNGFRRLAETDKIKADTKKSIGSFMQKGLEVNISTKVSEIPTTRRDNKFAGSEIDLIDELPGGKIDMEAVMRGELKAFG
jgi:hypothetical protein